MKLTRLTNLLVLGLILTVAAAGCKKGPGKITPLPGALTQKPGSEGTENLTPIKPGGEDTTGISSKNLSEGVSQPGAGKYDNYNRDAEKFRDQTVHFAFDSSVVSAAERPKLDIVAAFLKSNPTDAVEIDGHCDERGTEEYNRALGERRALALREELMRLGINGDRLPTVSFGEDKPVATGHDDAAWRQNRRGEFILLTPPAGQ